MSTPSRRLLWTDDDGPERFEYARWRLEAEGWEVRWAYSVEQAATLLRQEVFDAALLDQMLPFHDADREMNIWGGCTLLRWLKGLDVAPGAPATVVRPEGAPADPNAHLALAVLSAYRHEEVEAAMVEAMPADHPLAWFSKPIDVEALLRTLRASAR